MRERGERGLTLVELLVALTVLAVGVSALAGTFLATMRTAGSTSNRVRAVAIAVREMEALRALGFDRLRLAPDGVVPPGPDAVEEGGQTFRVSRTVTDDESAPATQRRVTVTVEWDDEAGPHRVTQATLVARLSGTATTTTTASTGPGAVGLSAAVNPGAPDREIDLAWALNGTAPAYWEIEHALSSSFFPTYVDTVTQPGSLTTYRKTGLSSGTTYWFRVRPAGGSGASWAAPASATTAADSSPGCAVRSVGVKPGSVRRQAGNTLSEDIAVEVNASEACTAFSIRFRPMTNQQPVVVDLSRPTTGSSWTTTIAGRAHQWDAGDHDVEVLAADRTTVVATMSVDVCRQQARSCP
jgi:type IV pilus assembly protein PilV